MQPKGASGGSGDHDCGSFVALILDNFRNEYKVPELFLPRGEECIHRPEGLAISKWVGRKQETGCPLLLDQHPHQLHS